MTKRGIVIVHEKSRPSVSSVLTFSDLIHVVMVGSVKLWPGLAVTKQTYHVVEQKHASVSLCCITKKLASNLDLKSYVCLLFSQQNTLLYVVNAFMGWV